MGYNSLDVKLFHPQGSMVLRFLKTSYQKLKTSLVSAGSAIGGRVRSLFSGGASEEALEELEEVFYEADLGVKTSLELVEQVRAHYRQHPQATPEEVLAAIKSHLKGVLDKAPSKSSKTEPSPPLVILVVGANGNGKTTSVAKIAHRFQQEGKSVLLAAADTFRAAAVEQLDLWAKRLGCDCVKGQLNSDPAAVAYDALSKARAKGHDVVIIDTAGRLHTKVNLMQELEKVKKACQKVHPGSPQETLLVLDVSIGQHAVDQARTFHQFTPLTGLVLTKLDGTARGGIVVAIQRELGVPIQFVGVGEGMEDLEPFSSEAFVEALFS